jgi:flavin-dependent dehydrogenase
VQTYDVAIIGAGPAGSAAATFLAKRSRNVLLLEKDRFPRVKVCGEFLSASALESLDRLGAREAIQALNPESIERGLIHLPCSRPISFRLPSPALGLSRFALDDLLVRRAQAAGTEVRFDTRVASIERDSKSFVIRSAGPAGAEIRARSVIGAWGRWDSLDRSLRRRFLSRPGRFLGWSLDHSGDTSSLAGLVQLYVFPGGYCGLSRVESGLAHLAGLISEKTRSRLGGGWETVVAHARRFHSDLDAQLSRLQPASSGCLGTGPVYFTRKPAFENGILMTGDAAGVIDPFSGEGQSVALASGILAAETVERALAEELSEDQVRRIYGKAWNARFGHRFVWGRLIRQAMLHLSVAMLARRFVGEPIANAALRGLAATVPLRRRA